MRNIQDKTKSPDHRRRHCMRGAGYGDILQFKTETPPDGGNAPASIAAVEVNPSADIGGKAGEKVVVSQRADHGASR